MADKNKPVPTLPAKVEAEIDNFWRESEVLMDPTTWQHLVARRDELKRRLAPLMEE